MAKVTEYGRKIKLSLMDAGKTQTWLISEVQQETGLYAGMTDGDIYSDNMMCVAYRLYLEGVQDGMKGDVKKKDE